jgi:hypothetical protein
VGTKITFPDRDGIATFGGPWRNLSPVVDPTTDASDAGINQMAEDVAAMTQMCPRAAAQFVCASSNAPSLLSHQAGWGNLPQVAPSVARTGVGTYTVAWPPTVNDEITSGPGFTSPHALGLIFGWANAVASAAFWHPQVVMTAANVATIYLYNSTLALADPASGPAFTVFVV